MHKAQSKGCIANYDCSADIKHSHEDVIRTDFRYVVFVNLTLFKP